MANIKSEHLEKGEVVFDKAIFSINDKSVKKVYNEIMRHKVHKRRVKQGLYYVIENIEAFERRDSNILFQVEDSDFVIKKPVSKEEQDRRSALKLKKASMIHKSKVDFLEDFSNGSKL